MIKLVPEGPEVEIVRIGLQDVIGQKIIKVKISDNKKYSVQKKQLNLLKASEIYKIERKGKFLLWFFSKSGVTYAALNHLGMTGVWHIYSDKKWDNIEKPFEKFKHYKLYIHFKSGLNAIFINIRTFGKSEIMSMEEIDSQPSIKKLGPDILDTPFDSQSFLRLIIVNIFH